LIDARFEEGELIVCSELVLGRDLETIVDRLRAQKKMVPFEVSIAAILSVLEGLHHAHELCGPDGRHLGLVHRDVAPKNIMVGYDGAVKLIDFGIAHADVGAFRTTPGMLVGTLAYLSPEQAMGGIVDRRTDVYCAGAVLFELL
jgi:serine/threonine protein kinase